jgi:tRNA pseudouridine38/39 synthase
MSNACQRLIGEHDFRNFCHIDRNTGRLEMSYIRTINNATIEELNNNYSCESCSSCFKKYTLLKLTIKATGFLWHQIRCIVVILYEIGCGNEKAEVLFFNF